MLSMKASKMTDMENVIFILQDEIRRTERRAMITDSMQYFL
jgi:hypothetical protein